MVRLVLRAVAIGAVLLTLGGAKAWAGFDGGLAAANRGDYETALREWRLLADQGYAGAQNNLGVMYDKGLGVPQDDAEAVKWYRKAAAQGYARAQYNLGVMYYHGHGVPQDYVQTVKWYRKAAEQGDAKAQYDLGTMYYSGQGVTQDYAEAAKWFRKAATQGYARAQYYVGVMYAKGRGVTQDYVQAHMWLILTGAKAAEVRGFTAERMTPADISKAERLAREWLEKHRGK